MAFTVERWRVRRRTVLAGCASVVAVGGAGCATVRSSNADGSVDGVRLVKLSVANMDDVPHSVDVVLERNGEVAYWNRLQVAEKSDGPESVETVSFDSSGSDPADWDILARIDERTDGKRYSANKLQGDGDCVWPVVQAVPTDDGGAEVGLAERLVIDDCDGST